MVRCSPLFVRYMINSLVSNEGRRWGRGVASCASQAQDGQGEQQIEQENLDHGIFP